MLRGSIHYCAIAPRALPSHIVDSLGSRQLETAPSSIEVFLRPPLGQSDEPSDLRGSLSPTTGHRCTHVSVYSLQHLVVPGGHPSNYGPGLALLNFSDRANTDELTPYSIVTGALAYADDVVLLAPTKHAMSLMLKICSEFSTTFDLIFNADKNKCIHFPCSSSRPKSEKLQICSDGKH